MTTVQSSRLFVDGIAWWSPGIPDWATASTIMAGRAVSLPVRRDRPAPALLPPAERRRAPDTVILAIEVAAQACAAAGLEPAALRAVFATTHGDLAITDYLCDILWREPLYTSPTKFHNSVHNAAAGYWCIATGCHAPYSTVSAAEFSCATGLLEAITLVAADATPVLFVAYDAGAHGPLATCVTSRGLLGVGFVLSPRRTADSVAEITWQVRAGVAADVTAPASGIAAFVGENAMAPCLPLFEALAARGGRITLALESTCLLELALSEPA